tara:strand:+ start:113 stop:622 length:510 start_codon:yes stop_codon:yes gene_type:complete
MFTLILLQSAGVMFVYKLQELNIKSEVKQQIKLGIAETDLITLAIPKHLEEKANPEFKRIHEKEFRYKGEMYDIISKVVKDDTTYYDVIHDPKESKLFAKLDELANNELNNDPAQKKISERIKSLFAANYIPSKSDIISNFPYSISTFCYYGKTYDDIFLPISSPPPKS